MDLDGMCLKSINRKCGFEELKLDKRVNIDEILLGIFPRSLSFSGGGAATTSPVGTAVLPLRYLRMFDFILPKT